MKEDIYVYNEELGLDGTITQLVDWSYRYDSDYSDEALEKISELAKMYGLPAEQQMIPLLVKESRDREAGTLPYEYMKLDKLRGGKISYSETKEYGEVEIREEGDKVLVSVTGCNDEGCFCAANAYTVKEFMEGDSGFLETAIGETLFYAVSMQES